MARPERRTLAHIAQLSHEEVKTQLLAKGLKPLELVPYISYEGTGPNPNKPLEPHQRHDWTEHDRIWYADDPLLNVSRNIPKPEPSPFDTVTLDHWWLYGCQLDRYVDDLTLSMITKKLETFGKDIGRTPQRHWSDQDYRKEMASRISQADHDDFVASHEGNATKPKTTKKKGGAT